MEATIPKNAQSDLLEKIRPLVEKAGYSMRAEREGDATTVTIVGAGTLTATKLVDLLEKIGYTRSSMEEYRPRGNPAAAVYSIKFERRDTA